MDSFSSYKTDDSSTLNSMKLMSPIESCYRSPLRDTTNCVLPLEVGGSKKSDIVGSHQLPGEKREFAEENNFSQCQQSTPVKHLDCDTESDTTAEYESAGEASPWEKPSNISALADYLAGVHLSTPDKIHTELTYFPFSPISAEDECDDEVTAIISNGSQSSSHTLSFHEREEICVSKQDQTVSNMANTSFSDVDPDEFKNSVPCKRHSETNVSSYLLSEAMQLNDGATGTGEISFETEMSCSLEDDKIKNPPPSLNESEDIISSVVSTVEELCDSVNIKVASSGKMTPERQTSLEASSSDNVSLSDVTHPTGLFADEGRLAEQPSSPTTDFSSCNKSPIPLIFDKDFSSLDSLEENSVSETKSSSNVLQNSSISDYVTTTKHKIDTIFNSNKEIVSNVISETKQQIDNMFKRKSPIKELATNTVSHVIGSIKNLNTIEPDSSPQRNVLIEKVTSPISSAKQKIDSLFSPKKTVLEKDLLAKEMGENDLLKKENETNQNNNSSNTVVIERFDLDSSTPGLSVLPITTASASLEVIETSKQQIDKIFKSLSSQKFGASSEVSELSNSTMSTDLDHEEEVCGISPPSCDSLLERNSKQVFSLSMNGSLCTSEDMVVNVKKEIEIDQTAITSDEKKVSILCEDDNSTVLVKDSNETGSVSKISGPKDFKLQVEDNISSITGSSKHLADDINDEIMNQTKADKVCDITIVCGGDEKSNFNYDNQVTEDSISLNSIEIQKQDLRDFQSTFEAVNKDTIEASHNFHVRSPKKESFNISLSTILGQKEGEINISKNITEDSNKSIIKDFSESLCLRNTTSTHSIDYHREISSIIPSIDETVINGEFNGLSASDTQNISDVKDTTHQSCEIIDKITGAHEVDAVFPPKSPEPLESQVTMESSDSINKKEVEDKSVLDQTVIEEGIGDPMVCEGHNDSHDGHSHSKPHQEALNITAVVDQMTLDKEVEDFVVVDSAELEKQTSVSVSPQLSSPDFPDKECLDSSHLSDHFEVEKDVSDIKESVLQSASALQVFEVEIIERQAPASSLKELMMENNHDVTDPIATITNLEKETNIEHIKESDTTPVTEISEADIVSAKEGVKCSSLVIPSVEVKNDATDTVPKEFNLNLQSNLKEDGVVNDFTENNLTFNVLDEKEVIHRSVASEENNAECVLKATEVVKNISFINDDSGLNKNIDDSVDTKNDSEQQKSSPVNSYSSNVNISSQRKIFGSPTNTLRNNAEDNANLNIIPNSSIKKESIEKSVEFEPLQSEPNQVQTSVEKCTSHKKERFENKKCTITEKICEKQTEDCLSKNLTEDEHAVIRPTSLDRKEYSEKITEDIVVVNEPVIAGNPEVYRPSINEQRRSPPGPNVTNDLFSEIFQHGKDQMCTVTSKNIKTKQGESGISAFEKSVQKVIEQDCNTTTYASKSIACPTYDDTVFLKNSEFPSELILSDKVKPPPFACPIPSETISFGSPTGHSLSLSPIDSFTPGAKCESPKHSHCVSFTGDNTSTVSSYKTFSSSAEIEMGLKSSSESLEFLKSDVSKQNNELSPTLQATLQSQGEMSTRNEKYSYTFNKSSKDFRGSPANKTCEEVKYSSLTDNFKTFKLDDLSKSTIERKSYEDLLDRCLEQERLLGFDETIKEEADKLIKEIANASSDDICGQADEFPPTNANNSEAGPVTADEDLNKGDLFQDATLFDFDYLSKIGKGKPSRRLVRESLFLKFDPLAAAAAAVATPEPAQEMAQADSSSDVINTPLRAPPPLHNGDDKLVSITPNDEAACSPASSTVATPPRSKVKPSSCSATPTLRHEILSKEISKLQDLMMKQESSYQEQIAACTEEVEQLREQLAELEARDNQSDLQGKLAATEAEAAKLRKELAEATESKKQLMMIMEEYEKTISQVVTMREDDKKKFERERDQISMEREGAIQHLRNMEIAFNDVHQKYEKCKEVIEAFKHNEEQYKISLNENRKTIIQQEENYQKLKEHAAQKLEQANIEITEMKKAHQAEIAKMVAVQRKMEIRVKSLEESLEQKKREAAELTKICDDLITKVEQ